MIFREDLRMSVRALLGRPAESLLLAVGVALAVGATAAGVTLAATTRAQSQELLAAPRYREIVVSTRAETLTMELPARVRTGTGVVLTVDDLERARSVTQAVRHAYLSNPVGFLLGELDAPAGKGDPAVSVTVVVPDGGAPAKTPPAAAAGEEAKDLLSLKESAGAFEAPVSMPDGPAPQLEFLHGLQVTPEFFAARGLTAAAGSLFTEADMARGDPLLVLGSQVASTLFRDGVALDRQVLSLNRLYRIVGVLAPTGTEADEQAFTPAPLAADRFKGFDLKGAAMDTALRFTVADPAHLDEARAQLAGHFDAVYGQGAVAIGIPRAAAEAAADRYRRLVTIILFLALASLLIAAVNMTNIFYSRAVRRQRAAGILKAVGARAPQVFAVFFVESLIVAAAGAAAGLGLAALLSRLMERTIGFGALHAGLVITGVAAAWTLVAACNVLPAAAAARMPAADAIRYE